MANKKLTKDLTNAVSYARPIVRTSGNPLETTGFYETLTEAQTYAGSADAYVGQIINVINDDVQPYVINKENGEIKRLIREQDIATSTTAGLVKINADKSFDGTNMWPVKLTTDDYVAYVEGTGEIEGVIDESKLLLSYSVDTEDLRDTDDLLNKAGVRGIHFTAARTEHNLGTSTLKIPHSFTGIQVCRSENKDQALLGVTSEGIIHTAYYDGDNGWSCKHEYKSYESGTPTFTSATIGGETLDSEGYTGNAATADKWSTQRTITLTGAVTSEATSVDGSANVTITTAVNHNHDADYVNVTGDEMSGTLTIANTTATNSASSGALVVNGGIGVGGAIYSANSVTANSFTANSDKRLKENIIPYTLTKNTILELPVYKFDFINGGTKNNIGCLAQDLKKICPEIVHENADGYLSIEESKIVYLLLEEVKQLRKELDELKGKM